MELDDGDPVDESGFNGERGVYREGGNAVPQNF